MLQIAGCGAGRDFRDELWGTADEAVFIKAGQAGFPHQDQVGLWFVERIEPHGGIIGDEQTGVFGSVNTQEGR